MRKGFVGLIGMIVGLVLLFVSFLGPWYMINATGIFGAEYTVGFHLTRVDLRGTIGGQDVSLSTGYTEAKMYIQDTTVNVESFAMVEKAMYLTLLALVTAVVAVVFIAAVVFEKGPPRTMKIGGGLCSVLTALLTLLPALYFMTEEFVENSSGFWFRYSAFGLTLSGGPGYAWYLMIVVAVISMISAAVLLLKKALAMRQ